jgi:hypothetical protein
MTNGLRFRDIASMPDGIRQAAERAASRIEATSAQTEKGDKRRKYGNQPTTVDGIRFDSKREARYYQQLKLEQQCGLVSYFLRQVPLHLPGGTRLVLDFLVVMADGRIRYVDAKGRETQAFRIKRREIQHHYPITVECV